MHRIKDLLLPIALIFAAIAVFETGARYGATNMRAHAIAGQLQLPLGILVSSQQKMTEQEVAQWSIIIDNVIATGVLHRQVWYLNEEAKAQLDKVLTYALSVRGDATAQYFDGIANNDVKPQGLSIAKLDEIRNALQEAKLELIDNAPSIEAVESDPQSSR